MAGIIARLARAFRADATSASSAYKTTGFGRIGARWRPANPGPNAALDYSADQLRAQSRELVRKNALAASAVERIVSNVVGTGIKPKLADDTLSALWTRWTDESAADGMLDLYGQQQQVMSAVVTAGECFVRLRNRLPVDGLSVPLQLEILEPEFVPTTLNQVSEQGGIIRQGIEFDPVLRSKRVAYWVYPQHPGDGSVALLDNLMPVRVPASEILHVYLPTRPGQIRGEPWMSRVLARLSDLDQYDEAELIRKKVAAMVAGFIKRATPSDLTLEDLKDIYGDEDTSIANGVGQVNMEAGSMHTLLPGEDIEFSAPSDVGGQYEMFKRSHQRDIAAALGLLYEQLTGDYSQVNDRTWRAAVTEFRRRCEGWQHHLLVFQFCRPVFVRWVDMAVLARAVTRASVKDLVPVWTPPAWPYINPLQDVQAREAEVRAGFTSRTAVVAERGEDASVIDAENAEDNKRADKLGVAYDSDGRRAMKGPVAQEAPTKAGESSTGQGGNAPANNSSGQPINLSIAVPERLTMEAVKALPRYRMDAETRDAQGRITSMIKRPMDNAGPCYRITPIYDQVSGRMIGTQEEPIETVLEGEAV